MYCVKAQEKNIIKHLFDGTESTMILSFFQGYMGRGYVNDKKTLDSACVVVGDFCFCAGTPCPQMIESSCSGHSSEFILAVAQSDQWHRAIEERYGGRAEKIIRYATSREESCFDKDNLLKNIAELNRGFDIVPIDEEIYKLIGKDPALKDLCSNFDDWETYREMGIGFVISQEGIPVSGASSYAVYDGGIEIEIDTRPEFRRRGLAIAAASKLILDCMERGIYPNWDAHDKRSLSLAQRLGYRLKKEYITYVINI